MKTPWKAVDGIGMDSVSFVKALSVIEQQEY